MRIYRFQKYRTALAIIVYHVVTTVGFLEEEKARNKHLNCTCKKSGKKYLVSCLRIARINGCSKDCNNLETLSNSSMSYEIQITTVPSLMMLNFKYFQARDWATFVFEYTAANFPSNRHLVLSILKVSLLLKVLLFGWGFCCCGIFLRNIPNQIYEHWCVFIPMVPTHCMSLWWSTLCPGSWLATKASTRQSAQRFSCCIFPNVPKHFTARNSTKTLLGFHFPIRICISSCQKLRFIYKQIRFEVATNAQTQSFLKPLHIPSQNQTEL